MGKSGSGRRSFEEIDPGSELRAEWTSATKSTRDILNDQSLATKQAGGQFGKQPIESLVGRLLCARTVIYTWELARATGQDDRLNNNSAEEPLWFLDVDRRGHRSPGWVCPKTGSAGWRRRPSEGCWLSRGEQPELVARRGTLAG